MAVVLSGFSAVAVIRAASRALADTGDHWTRAFSGPLFLLGMFSPVLLITLVIAAVVRLGVHARGAGAAPLPLWPCLALVICAMSPLFMTTGDIGLLIFWPAVLAVTLLWHRFERSRGRPGLRRSTVIGKGLTLAALGVAVWHAATAVSKAALFAQVTLYPPGPGEPPFTRAHGGTLNARPLTAEYRLALHRFPDPAACLQPGADLATAEGLARMDWDRITARAEAEVCLFRLIASLPGGMEGITDFATAQGFTVSSDDFSPDNPFVEGDGALRVTGFWSLRRNGPKYPTRGLMRIVAAVPYGGDVDATYAPDGKRLLHVQVGFLAL